MTLILRQVCLFNIQFGKSLTIDSSFTRVMMWLPLFSSPCKGREAEGGQKQWEEQIWTRSARRMANASSHLKPVSLNCWILLVCFGDQCFVRFCEANRCGEVSYLTNLTTCSLAQLSEKYREVMGEKPGHQIHVFKSHPSTPRGS